MEQIQLKATLREGTGKEAAKRLRGTGFIPAIVYHRGEEAVSISVENKEMTRIVNNAGGENVLINLTIEKEKKPRGRSVIIKEIQQHPVKRSILHIDFNEISLTEMITVEVEVLGLGEPIGVKQEGGTLDHPNRTLKIQCLPTDIPKHIDVDLSGLALNQTIHVKDLKISEKIKVLTDPDILLFQVRLHEEKKEEETTAETPELEVIREKKEEAAPAGEAKKEAPKAEKK